MAPYYENFSPLPADDFKRWPDDYPGAMNVGRGIGKALKRTGTAPVYQDIKKAGGAIVDVLGNAGDTILNTARRGLNYFTGANIPMQGQAPVAEELTPEAARAAGRVSRGIGRREPPATVERIPLNTEESSSEPSTQEHPWSKFKDEYEMLASLNDEDFKRAVDASRGEIPGIGYIENEGKIQRLIERPSKTPPGRGMTLAEAKLVAETNLTREQQLANRNYQQGVLAYQNRSIDEVRKAGMDQRKVQGFEKNLANYGKTLLGGVDENLGLARMLSAGHRPEDMPAEYQKPAQEILNSFEETYRSSLKAHPEIADTLPARKKAWATFENLISTGSGISLK